VANPTSSAILLTSFFSSSPTGNRIFLILYKTSFKYKSYTLIILGYQMYTIRDKIVYSKKSQEELYKILKDKKSLQILEVSNSIYIESGNVVKDYKVLLDTSQSDIKGDYTIKIGDNKETVPVTYSNGKLNYGSEVTPLYDEEILNLVVQRDYFASLNIKETFKSAETELSDIIYKAENQSVLYKKIVEKYNLPSDTKLSVSLSHAYYNRYDVLLNFESKQKVIQISTAIYLVKRK